MSDTHETAEGVEPEVTAVVEPEGVSEPVSKPVMTVSRKKAPEGAVVEASEPDRSERTDGETRTVTDAGPVQMATPQSDPREVEELSFGGIVIVRNRY